MRKTRGVTLLEVLITAGMTVLILYAAVQAMAMGIGYNEHIRAGRTTEERRREFERGAV